MSSDFLCRFERCIRELRLLPRRSRFLVGVSGGLDSTLLLMLLHELAASWGWQITVGHFNHGLRGRASGADERFVRRLSDRLGLPCITERQSVADAARRRKVSIEVAARDLRHDFFARTATEISSLRVVTAHHADDQAELLLIRLIRGSGPEGLGGMSPSSVSPVSRRVRLVRPLLGFTRAAIEAEARRRGMKWREDGSNLELDPLRNRIRQLLIPKLEEVAGREVVPVVARTMEILREESNYVAQRAGEWAERIREGRWQEVPIVVQRRWLVSRLLELGVTPEFELVERLRLGPGKAWTVQAGMVLQLDAHGSLSVVERAREEFREAAWEIDLRGRSGRFQAGGRTVRWRIIPAGVNDWRRYRSNGVEVFDSGCVGPSVTIRHWRPGDRFEPIGLGCRAKLQDLFVTAKIPAGLRRGLLVGETNSTEIFWVEGLRIGQRCRVTELTRKLLIWEVVPVGERV